MNTFGWFLVGTVVGTVIATVLYVLLVVAACSDENREGDG